MPAGAGAAAEGISADHGRWILVVDEQRQPRGWLDCAAVPVGHAVAHEDLVLGGSLATPDSSLRRALDAALSSPSGRGVAVDGDGVVIGTIAAGEVLAAIEQAAAGLVIRDSRPSRSIRSARPGPRLIGTGSPGTPPRSGPGPGPHLVGAVPTVLGLLLALPLGAIAHRYRWSYATLITLAGLLYTIPSIALFVVLPGLLSTRILDPLNVVVALTLYTLALLVRVVADALDAVPALVVASATAMGYKPLRSLLTVQLPLAVPVIGAGLRVAAVSNVSLVSVAALLGIPQLGQLFTVGFQLDFFTPIIAGIVLCLVLAAIFDVTIQLIVRLSTPWTRAVKH